MGTVLIPIPDRDFDPTEAAVSWQVLTAAGDRVVFATETGVPGTADDIMVTGRGLDVWSAIPIVGRATFIGRFLRANKAPATPTRRCCGRPNTSVPDLGASQP